MEDDTFVLKKEGSGQGNEKAMARCNLYHGLFRQGRFGTLDEKIYFRTSLAFIGCTGRLVSW
jgi:hypothetical protein